VKSPVTLVTKPPNRGKDARRRRSSNRPHRQWPPRSANLIRGGYVNKIFAGNALANSRYRANHFSAPASASTSPTPASPKTGHEHHLPRNQHRIRRCGSIRAAVDQGMLTSGIMYECVKNTNVDFLLAGSIRDDGPPARRHHPT